MRRARPHSELGDLTFCIPLQQGALRVSGKLLCWNASIGQGFLSIPALLAKEPTSLRHFFLSPQIPMTLIMAALASHFMKDPI